MSSNTSPTENIVRLSAAPAVELAQIGKKFDLAGRPAAAESGVSLLWALKDVTLSVAAGRAFGIIGRNGAGKTTLLNIIAGIMAPDEGKAMVPGNVMGLFNIGAGFQDELSGRENIYLNGAVLGAGREELDSRMADILEFSELGEFIDMPLGSFSQGMRLRLGFSIIANLDFDVLVLDEVLAVGDALFQDKCLKRLMDFKRLGKTLILSTQDLAMVERLCDSAALLDHGSLVFLGPPADAVNRYRALLSTARFYVGPVPKAKTLVESTKKWTDDAALWGTTLGTKEVEIERVVFSNRLGFKADTIRSGQRLRVKVWFLAKNSVRDPHFGIAIFRKDGVYCYGPNTAFDGYRIPEIRKGAGHFTLDFTRVFLQPGDYRVSVAIWDENEALAYDYHNGCYRLIIAGSAEPGNPLIKVPFRVGAAASRGLGRQTVWLDKGRPESKSVYVTGKPCTINLFFDKQDKDADDKAVCGIYRDDGIYCQGFPVRKTGRCVSIGFDRLLLLPGAYEIRFDDCRYPFRVIADRYDHGTVHLDHVWSWKSHG